MIQRFFVPGPLPSMNELLAAKRHGRGRQQDAYGKLKKRWAVDVQASALVARVRPVQRAHVRFCWVELHRRRDLDNISGAGQKLVLDALVAAGLLPDDGWNEILSLNHTFTVDPDEPGVLVELESP